ncbi:alpha/beta fold hydrolase [Pseudonocardia acidicola]|uniref:Alpha/beta fold hydrolase n=1 Tax=Pseudonocardia acidicola TaxID=2724939 RepID=A0ABX1S9W7_9PSEU|nr:alpha/beta fold hydrolase [Pseudonocardia acidicola]NMH97347.1 alpha/beta fold hydrolase [Pseudonocardia acidicola]
MHYHEAGHGPAVVMLHGGGPGATAWSNFSHNIGPFAERHRTVLVDMLGFGRSDSVVFDSEPATTVRARALRDLLDTLGIERASFVGNSMGGTTAMAFAVDYPERTERLVLMGAAGMTRTLIVPQPTEGHRRLAEASADPSVETMQELVNTMLYDPSIVSREMIEARAQAARNESHRDAAARSTALWRDQAEELARIRARTLIIWGREDRVNPLEIGLQLLRDIPGSRLLVFRECGHWAQIEHAAEFNRVALEFLAAA